MVKKEPEPETTQPQNLTIADLLEAVSGSTEQEETAPATDIEFASEVVEKLFDPSSINMITSLSKKELSGVMKLYLIKNIIYGGGANNVLARLIQTYLELKISEHRQGRSELVKAILGTKGESEVKGNVFRRYLE